MSTAHFRDTAVAAESVGGRDPVERVELTGFPAFGTLAHFLFDPLAATRRTVATHGDIAYITPALSAGARKPIIHVAGAKYAEAVFKNHEVFQNGGIILKAKAGSVHNQLRLGYFSANGKEYDHYVKLFGPQFRKKLVESAHPIIARVVTNELDKWPVGDRFDVIPHINRLMKVLASQGLFRDPDVAAGLHAADMVEKHGRISGASVRSVMSATLGGRFSSELHRQAKATYEAIVDWGKTRGGVPADRDILSAIVNAPTEDGQPASPERIAGYGWTMLGAAYDTSTSILSWLLVFISARPDVAQRLHEEIAQSGLDRRSEIAMAQIMELPYLDGVIKEVLRLIPPAPIQRRKAVVDTDLCGHDVPRGSQVLVSGWMTNRDEALYPDSERFNPDRWAGLVRSPYQWLTFSAGPRRCLGIWFALTFLKAIMAGMMIRWRPEIPDGAKINMKVAVTVRPIPAIPMVLSPTDGKFRASRIGGNVHRYVRLN